jgi:4-amino-4-deoxy-L-arabinose transferase-like glycosyltransferase
VTVVVISLAKGIIHPYYSVAAAPAIGAMVGIGASALWEQRKHLFARIALAAALAATAVWSFVLLDRAPQWMPWLRPVVLAVGLVTAVLLVVQRRLRGKAAVALGSVGVCVALAGPAAYALDTVATPHSGAIPSAGPSSVTGPGGVPGGPGGRFGAGPGGAFTGRGAAGGALRPGVAGTGGGTPPSGFGPGGGVPRGSFPAGGPGGQTATPRAAGAGASPFGGSRRGGGAGGFLSISTPGAKLVKALEADAHSYTWVAATVNSNSAAGYQLATDDPVMAIGGFNGTDPAPTVAQFERDVADKKIHYFISGGGGLGSGSSGTTAGQITQWVESHFSAQTLNGVTVYDLSGQ